MPIYKGASSVKITLVPSSTGGTTDSQYQFLTSYLINNCVAIDAGSVGLFGSPQQRRVPPALK